MELPFPTGKEIEIKQSQATTQEERNQNRVKVYNEYATLIQKYNSILNIRRSNGNLIVELKENPDLGLVKQFLEELNTNGLSEIDDVTNRKLMKDVGFGLAENETFNIGEAIAKIANIHNKYLDKVNQSTLTSIAKNYSMYKMYKVIDTPVNLIQAQSSVDAMTGPLKKIGNKQPVSALINVRTPGNVFDKAESIEDNQVGKDGIGICAVGMKAFFGLTAYANTIANYGTEEQQKRLALGYNGRGIPITLVGDTKATWYHYMSNINPKKMSKMFDVLSLYNSDTDAALILSALLSLATDNAKELQLSKLNAGTKTIGMYIYGITIGMNFQDISDIMTSKVGWLITDLTKSNVFTGERGIFSIDKVFDYIENGPHDLMQRFDETTLINGQIVKSPVEYLAKVLAKTKYEKDLDPYDLFCKLAWDVNMTLEDKINYLENLKGTYSYVNSYGKRIDLTVDVIDKQKFNQCIDQLEEYFRQVDIVKHDMSTYQSLQTLAEGGEEFRVLGQILGLNQGLKTKPEEIMQRVFDILNSIQARSAAISHKIERKAKMEALLNEKEIPISKSSNVLGMFDLVKFCFDEDYRNEQIQNYDKVKHSVNILDVAMTVPHFAGYVQTLATDYQTSRLTSRKFDTMVRVGEKLINDLKASSAKDKQQIFKGIGNYYSDYVRRAWMLDTLPPLSLNPGTKTIVNGKVVTDSTEILLGTADGDASFKYLMENEIIPNLQKGKLGDNAIESLTVSENKFIKDLTTALLTTTVTHNPVIYYTLPINMLPSTDEERGVFNTYKSEFNKLQGLAYELNGIKIPLVDLFYYYGLIAHYGKQGRQSLMPIFENLHQVSDFKIRDFHTYEALFNEEIPLITEDFYPYVLKTQNPYNATSRIIYAQDPETMVTEIWEKVSRKDFEDDIKNMAETEEISGDIAWYRIQKGLGMRNGYLRKLNPILRDNSVNNYYMITEDPSLGQDILNHDKITIKAESGDYKIVADNMVNTETGYVGITDIAGHKELLDKYPLLKKAPIRKVDGRHYAVDIDAYTALLNQAISEENNECNVPY